MIRTVARDDFVTPGEEASDLDRVLVGFGAAVGKEECVDVAGSNLSEFCAEASARLRCHKWVGIAECLRLLVHRVDHALVAVADIDRHQLAVEVDEALPFRRPEIDSFGAGDWDGIDLRLRRPLKQSVFLGEINNFLARHRGCSESSSHGLLGIVCEVIADDFVIE